MATNVSIIEISPKRVSLEVNTVRPLVEISVGTSIGNTTLTASNLGSGEGVFAQKLGTDFQFKSLVEGDNVSLSSDGSEITIGVTGLVNPVSDFTSGTVTTDAVVDSFAIGLALGVRWDYIITGDAQRSGSIIATWLADGSIIEYTEYNTVDIDGDTSPVTLSVEYTGGNIRLLATIASGSWTISGNRLFIPTNGAGTGPISDSLAYGNIYIGNVSNIATAQSITGDISLSPTGVTSIVSGVIIDSDINAAAAIAVSKLASMSANFVVITNGSGKLTTSSITPTKLGYLTDVTSNIGALINTKLSNSLNYGSLFIGDASNVVNQLSIGAVNTVLTSNGTTASWALPTGVTTDGSASLKYKVIQIGDWNMVTTSAVNINHGVADFTKIREVEVMIINDIPDKIIKLDGSATVASTPVIGGSYQIHSTYISLSRNPDPSAGFNSANYNALSYNRGWITIGYEI